MWTAIRWLLLRIAAVRLVFKLGWLGLLIPLAFVLKSIGLPLLIILALLALPVLLMFFVFGLPVFLVVMAGGAFMGFISFVLTLSLAVLKVGLFILFPIWFIFAVAPRIARWFKGGNGGNGGGEPTTSAPPPPPPPPGAAGDFDPS